jgi:hypothetical protein
MEVIYDFFKCSEVETSPKNCSSNELAMMQWGGSNITNQIHPDYAGYDKYYKLSNSVKESFAEAFDMVNATNTPELAVYSKTPYTRDNVNSIFDRFFGISDEQDGSMFYLSLSKNKNIE